MSLVAPTLGGGGSAASLVLWLSLWVSVRMVLASWGHILLTRAHMSWVVGAYMLLFAREELLDFQADGGWPYVFPDGGVSFYITSDVLLSLASSLRALLPAHQTVPVLIGRKHPLPFSQPPFR